MSNQHAGTIFTTGKNFNDTHPEMHDGEVWRTNVTLDQVENDQEAWSAVCFKSKRLGDHAYDKDGNVLPGQRPVFVQKDEANAELILTVGMLY
jgi:hypothetical protein